LLTSINLTRGSYVDAILLQKIGSELDLKNRMDRRFARRVKNEQHVLGKDNR
jgi:hypothetical protein